MKETQIAYMGRFLAQVKPDVVDITLPEGVQSVICSISRLGATSGNCIVKGFNGYEVTVVHEGSGAYFYTRRNMPSNNNGDGGFGEIIACWQKIADKWSITWEKEVDGAIA